MRYWGGLNLDRLLSMEVFVKVAQLGSFSKAASQFGMSKSTVSKSITELEKHLGVRLFNRTTRRLSLTEGGHIYLDRALGVLEAAKSADQAVTRLNEVPRGMLKVNAPMSFGIRHISPLIPPFLNAYPEVGIELTLNDRRVDLVDEGFDVAVRIGELEDSTLVARTLTRSRSVCVASPAYLAKRQPPKEPRDLSGHECLLYNYSRNPNEWPFHRNGELSKIRVEGRLRANNGDILREAVIKGLGIAYMPSFLLDDAIHDKRLEVLLPEWQTHEVMVRAVYPETRQVSPKLRVFVDYLAKMLKNID